MCKTEIPRTLQWRKEGKQILASNMTSAECNRQKEKKSHLLVQDFISLMSFISDSFAHQSAIQKDRLTSLQGNKQRRIYSIIICVKNADVT